MTVNHDKESVFFLLKILNPNRGSSSTWYIPATIIVSYNQGNHQWGSFRATISQQEDFFLEEKLIWKTLVSNSPVSLVDFYKNKWCMSNSNSTRIHLLLNRPTAPLIFPWNTEKIWEGRLLTRFFKTYRKKNFNSVQFTFIACSFRFE